MVVFTCNACNESLKKNQVEKHYTQKCRKCDFLSCVDCGKEFWGDTYQTHIKCISEDEKYSGKNYVAKVNKGEVKQEQWIQKVQAAIQKAQTNPQLKNLLQKLEEFPNVPRKKAKFENFVKCSLRVHNPGLISQVWDLLMREAQQHQQQNGNNINSNGKNSGKKENEDSKQPEQAGSQTEDSEQSEKKPSKRERKEERRKKGHKDEKKDNKMEGNGTAGDEGKSKRKGKRKKREEESDAEDENLQPVQKKSKGDVTNGSEETTEETEEASTGGGVKMGKFDWGATITAVLKSKGEISVKKLRKKILAEYASYGGGKGEERAEAKFTKRLHRLPNVRVLKDRAKLIDS